MSKTINNRVLNPPPPKWGSNPEHLYFTSMNPNVSGSIPTSGGIFDPMSDCFLTLKKLILFFKSYIMAHL